MNDSVATKGNTCGHQPDLTGTTLAILQGEGRSADHSGYLLYMMRKIWIGWGATIIDLIGPNEYVPADLLLVHVDLSLVPPDYRRLAERYPIAINGLALDIRKASYCPHLLRKGDDWSGKVVVKTNNNYAGLPEQHGKHGNSFGSRLAFRAGRKWRTLTKPTINSKADYTIYESLSEVPTGFTSDDFVIQKFCPEMLDGEYVLREYYFFGDVEVLSAETGADAILTEGTGFLGMSAEPAHPTLREMRVGLHLDYGKIDYVMVDGEPFIFDANKTVGTRQEPTENNKNLARLLAFGLIHYLPK